MAVVRRLAPVVRVVLYGEPWMRCPGFAASERLREEQTRARAQAQARGYLAQSDTWHEGITEGISGGATESEIGDRCVLYRN